METSILLIALPIALAVWIGLSGRGRAAGWLLIAAGIILLGYSGTTIYGIWARDGVVTNSSAYYWLFAEVPAGILLALGGGAILCARFCFRKYADRRAKTQDDKND